MLVVVKVTSDSGNSLLRSSGCQGGTCTSGLPDLACQVLGYSGSTAASFFDESRGQDGPARVQGEERRTAPRSGWSSSRSGRGQADSWAPSRREESSPVSPLLISHEPGLANGPAETKGYP